MLEVLVPGLCQDYIRRPSYTRYVPLSCYPGYWAIHLLHHPLLLWNSYAVRSVALR